MCTATSAALGKESIKLNCPQKFGSCLLAIMHSFNDNTLISSALLDYFKHLSSYVAKSIVHTKLVEEGMRKIKKVLLLKGIKKHVVLSSSSSPLHLLRAKPFIFLLINETDTVSLPRAQEPLREAELGLEN